tara:strand:- start:1009 stop:1593 length:585 start_codon:yes stop_codon:yes gene_type:complete
MSSWGATDSDESKPKYIIDSEKKEVYADAKGWVRQAGTKASGNDNPNATPEVLVAIGSLATKLGQATIDAVRFTSTSVSGAGGSVVRVEVDFNEQVTVSSQPCLMVVTNSQAGGGGAANLTLTMDGTLPVTNDTLTFSTTASNAAVNQNDVLSIGAQTIDKNGGTVVDTVGGGNAEMTVSSAVSSAADTLTVGA